VQGREALDKADIPSNPNTKATMSKTEIRFRQLIINSEYSQQAADELGISYNSTEKKGVASF
jgi:hypothetical protein